MQHCPPCMTQNRWESYLSESRPDLANDRCAFRQTDICHAEGDALSSVDLGHCSLLTMYFFDASLRCGLACRW